MGHWKEAADQFEWMAEGHSGSKWAIRWQGLMPGLYWLASDENCWIGPVMGGIGLAAKDMPISGELNSSNLTQIELIKDRCELTFVPEGWHETTVRLCWTPTGQEQFDLMTEVLTRSVGMLNGVELGIECSAWSKPEQVDVWLEAMRDKLAVSRSQDGRESAWFASQPKIVDDDTVFGTGEERIWHPGLIRNQQSNQKFLVSSHPDDISRRYRDHEGRTQRTWLMGYDMERGVVFRTRNRCQRVDENAELTGSFIDQWQADFLDQPLPLYR